MKQSLLLAVLAAVLGGVLVRECFPRTIQGPIPVPTIVTVHDTTHDTVRIAPPKLPPMPNLVMRVTFHTPIQIRVDAPPEERSPLWPVLNAQIGKSRGDTSQVITFSLRSGQTAVSKIWTPAPLRAIYADTTATPRLDFYEPELRRAVSLWTKVKWTSVGFGLCRVQEAVR